MPLFELVRNKTRIVSLALLLVLFIAYNANAQDTDTNEWQYEATIYGWLPEIDGTASHSGGPFELDVSDILDNLSMVFMGTFEVHKNKWSIIADAIYLDIGNDKNTIVKTRSGAPLITNVDLDISSWFLTGAVGYEVVQSDRATFAIVGGVRYAALDVDVTLGLMGLQADESKTEGLLDAIVGLRGAIKLGEHWYVPYYADIGTGESDITWQALAGIGYQFSWGDIKLVYRYLSYEMDDDSLLKDLDVSGPALGLGFRF